jgi:hypothetical protein
MSKLKKYAVLFSVLGLAAGMAGTIALQTHAAGTTTTSAGSSTSTTQPKMQGHAPLGGDGFVTAINGTNITMQEEANEGGATYTVSANNATVTNSGATAALSDIKVGDKIFVRGTTSGTNVAATSVSLGHPTRHGFTHSKSN